MAIYHLERSYLNWRAIPCKENDLYLCSFSSFSQHFFLLSWFSFRLNLNFSSAWHDNHFSFCFLAFFLFLVLTVCLLRATTQIIDDLSDWSISSHVRIVLKGLAFGSRVVYIIPVQRKDMAQKILEKWATFSQCVSRH